MVSIIHIQGRFDTKCTVNNLQLAGIYIFNFSAKFYHTMSSKYSPLFL